jgi:Na+-transporting methylmalonyl-CoA/oxaloacetate decarboxylase gamma subunit
MAAVLTFVVLLIWFQAELEKQKRQEEEKARQAAEDKRKREK